MIQICLVVEDMDEAVKYWAKLFNIEEPDHNPSTFREFLEKHGSSWTVVDCEDKLGVNINIKPVR